MDSFLRAATSLPRSIKSSARSRSSRALRVANSLLSSAFWAMRSRVSSPERGAKSTPTRAPTPRPTRKKLILEPTLSAMVVILREKRNIAKRVVQYHLTSIQAGLWLCDYERSRRSVRRRDVFLALSTFAQGRCIRLIRCELCQDTLGALARHDATQAVQIGSTQIGNTAEFSQQFPGRECPDAWNVMERGACLTLAAA